MFRSLPRAAAALALLMIAVACKKAPPTNVAATVNNRVITYTELDKTYHQSQLATAGEGASEDQTMAQKLELLRSMIDSEIMLQRAEEA